MADILGLSPRNESPAAVPVRSSTAAMLERLNRRVAALPVTALPAPPRQPRRHFLHALRRNKSTVVLASALGLLFGAAYVVIPQPLYQASTTLELLDATPNQTPDILPYLTALQSRSLRQRVAARLGIPLAFRPGPDAPWRQYLRLPDAAPDVLISQVAATLRISPNAAARTVEITATSPNPALAAAWLNTLTTEFIDERLESRWHAARRAGDMLTRQLTDLKTRLETSEAELQLYASTTTLPAADDKLRQLQSQFATAQGDRAAKQARYDIASTTPADGLGEVLDDDSLRLIRQKLTDLRRELADLNASMAPEYVRTKRIQAQIATLEADSEKSRARILDRIHNDLLAARTREQLLSRELALQTALATEQSGKTARYNLLKQEVDSNRQLHQNLLQRVSEAGISATLSAGTFRVVDPAVPPATPLGPGLPRAMFLGLLTGLCGGLGLVLLRHTFDDAIRAPGETPSLLGAPELGVIPFTAPAMPRSTTLALSAGVPELITFTHATSATAEATRLALASVLLAGRDGKPPRVIAVTSANAGHGATTVASNLAIAVAEMNWSVLLIDANLRSPRLHGLFGVNTDQGLANILQGEPVSATGVPTHIPNLHVLPRGRLKGSPTSLLAGPAFSDLLAHARQSYDVVLIDAPATEHLADAQSIGTLVDGVLLVVRAGQTQPHAIEIARARLAKAPLLGSILNG